MIRNYKYQKQYRYKDYDYSRAGYYFVTICSKNRELFFGKIINSGMKLSIIGEVAEKFWREISGHFPLVNLDEYIIMPNHLHGIIQINQSYVGTGHCPVPTSGHCPVPTSGHCPVPTSGHCPVPTSGHCPVPTSGSKFGRVIPNSISTIIGSYKSIVTKTINKRLPDVGFAWQSRFHDRIIRNDSELSRIRQYIKNNPAKWESDRNNLINYKSNGR